MWIELRGNFLFVVYQMVHARPAGSSSLLNSSRVGFRRKIAVWVGTITAIFHRVLYEPMIVGLFGWKRWESRDLSTCFSNKQGAVAFAIRFVFRRFRRRSGHSNTAVTNPTKRVRRCCRSGAIVVSVTSSSRVCARPSRCINPGHDGGGILASDGWRRTGASARPLRPRAFETPVSACVCPRALVRVLVGVYVPWG